jgi:hypothetical protein
MSQTIATGLGWPHIPEALRPVHPSDLASDRLTIVRDGAVRPTGMADDALLAVDHVEHDRRLAVGCGPVTNRRVLNALLDIPLGTEIPISSIDPDHTEALFDLAPPGTVQWRDQTVIRLLRPAAFVVAALIHGRGWRDPLRRAAGYARGYTQAVMMTDQQPRAFHTKSWEADFCDVGVWIRSDAETKELIPPTPFRPRRIGVTWWRFHETAYQRWLAQSDHPALRLSAANPLPPGQAPLPLTWDRDADTDR